MLFKVAWKVYVWVQICLKFDNGQGYSLKNFCILIAERVGSRGVGANGHASISTVKIKIHEKNHVVYLVRSGWYDVLWLAQTEQTDK